MHATHHPNTRKEPQHRRRALRRPSLALLLALGLAFSTLAMAQEQVDVVVVGAGMAGLGAARRWVGMFTGEMGACAPLHRC